MTTRKNSTVSTSGARRSAPTRGRAVPPKRRNIPWLAIALVLIIAAPVALFLYASRITAPTGAIEGVVEYPDLPRDHQDGALTYEQTPPAGGNHNAAWQNCGTYNQPVGNQYAVHSLEHGAVWLAYRPDLPADQIELVKQAGRGRSHALVTPYPDLPSPVVATAWGVQLPLDSADDPRLARFVAKYAQGSQTPEPGAACTGGISSATGGS